MEETQTHASNTGTCTHADEGTSVSEGDGDKLMGKYEIRLVRRIQNHMHLLLTDDKFTQTSVHIINAQNMAEGTQP